MNNTFYTNRWPRIWSIYNRLITDIFVRENVQKADSVPCTHEFTVSRGGSKLTKTTFKKCFFAKSYTSEIEHIIYCITYTY